MAIRHLQQASAPPLGKAASSLGFATHTCFGSLHYYFQPITAEESPRSRKTTAKPAPASRPWTCLRRQTSTDPPSRKTVQPTGHPASFLLLLKTTLPDPVSLTGSSDSFAVQLKQDRAQRKHLRTAFAAAGCESPTSTALQCTSACRFTGRCASCCYFCRHFERLQS